MANHKKIIIADGQKRVFNQNCLIMNKLAFVDPLVE